MSVKRTVAASTVTRSRVSNEKLLDAQQETNKLLTGLVLALTGGIKGGNLAVQEPTELGSLALGGKTKKKKDKGSKLRRSLEPVEDIDSKSKFKSVSNSEIKVLPAPVGSSTARSFVSTWSDE